MERKSTTEFYDIHVSFLDYLKVAKYARYITKEIVCKILQGLLVTASYVFQAIALAQGVGSVFARTDIKKCLLWYGIVIACIIFRAFLTKYQEGYTKQIGGKIKTVLREMLVGKLLELGPEYQADKRSGRFQSLVTDGIEYIEPYFVSYIPQVFIVFFSVLPMVIYIFANEPVCGAIVLVSTTLAILMPHIFMRYYTVSCIGYWKNYAVLNAQYIDTMQGMNTLKLFNAEGDKGKELRELSERFRILQETNTRNSLFSNANIALMTGIATSVMTGVAAYSCNDGKISASVLMTFLFLVIECVRPIGDLNNAWHASMMGFSVASELLEILDAPVSTKEKENPVVRGLESGLPSIEFKNVSFSYNNKREEALKNVSFSIVPGETVAIAGSSGAGKSTVINLLLRFYDVSKGSIRINGVDLKDYEIEYLRSKIAVVFQNTYLFYGTVRENIRMAAPNATDEEIIEAAKVANAHAFIMELPKGYDTIVGERGDTLSGGQQQRIAIARAILKKAPVLLLDEATSSVDAASEAMIQETIENLRGRFTTIIIAHRLSTIQNAGRILVLNQGELKECGSHEELLKKKGIYAGLIAAQNGDE